MSFGVCNTGKSGNWLLIAGAAILAGILIFFLLTTGVVAFGGAFSTAAPAVAVGAAVPFTSPSPLANITFTAPSTLTLGPTAGGTYAVSYDVNLALAAGGPSPFTFGVAVNGVVNPATTGGVILGAAPSTGVIHVSATIAIPSGATVTLVNVGPTAATLNNVIGGLPIVSADLNLERLGP